MAHKQQADFCLYVKGLYPHLFDEVDVLDVGSLDVNGNNRYLFDNYSYTGIDLGEGPNVDIVSKGHEYKPNKQFDVVISTECFEHDMHWKETIKNCVELTKSGGLFIFTCASTGRPEHGTSRSLDWASPFSHLQFNDYYKNLTEDDIMEVLDPLDFTEIYFEYNKKAADLYFYGIKR